MYGIEGVKPQGVDVLDRRISQDHRPGCVMPHRRAYTLSLTVHAPIFQFPRPSTGIVSQAGIVIPLVEVLQYAGEDFGLFVG